jgi:hypothetical protein
MPRRVRSSLSLKFLGVLLNLHRTLALLFLKPEMKTPDTPLYLHIFFIIKYNVPQIKEQPKFLCRKTNSHFETHARLLHPLDYYNIRTSIESINLFQIADLRYKCKSPSSKRERREQNETRCIDMRIMLSPFQNATLLSLSAVLVGFEISSIFLLASFLSSESSLFFKMSFHQY